MGPAAYVSARCTVLTVFLGIFFVFLRDVENQNEEKIRWRYFAVWTEGELAREQAEEGGGERREDAVRSANQCAGCQEKTRMFKNTLRLFSTSRAVWESSCKEGTKINLNIYKNGKPIVALKDEEYPEWLWGLLDKDLQTEQLKKDDVFRYNRKIIKKQNVARIKMNNFMQNMK